MTVLFFVNCIVEYYSKSLILSHTFCMTRSLTFSVQSIFLFVFYVRQCNAICNVNIAMQCFLLWAWQCFDCAAMKEFCFFSDNTVEVSELGQAQLLLQNQRSMGSAAYCVQRRISYFPYAQRKIIDVKWYSFQTFSRCSRGNDLQCVSEDSSGNIGQN